MAECDDRDRRRAARRIHDAAFPRHKRIEEFDFRANSSINPAVIHQLATCAWVKAGHPLSPSEKNDPRSLSRPTSRSPKRTCSREPVSGRG
jgi:IstB-like ATP binding protein